MSPNVKGLDIEGVVKVICDVKEMTGEHGAWKSQFIVIEESKEISCGASIKIEGDPIDEKLKGKRIKLVGCKVADSTYKGKPSKIIYANGWTPPDAGEKLREATGISAHAEPVKEESPFKKNLPALKEPDKDNLIVREVAAKGSAVITAAAIKGCNPTTEVCKSIFKDMADYITEWIKS